MNKYSTLILTAAACLILSGCKTKSVEGKWNVVSDSEYKMSDYTITFQDGVMTTNANADGVKVLAEERYRYYGSTLDTPGAKVTIDASGLEGERRKQFESMSTEFRFRFKTEKTFSVKMKDSNHMTLTEKKRVIELERAN